MVKFLPSIVTERFTSTVAAREKLPPNSITASVPAKAERNSASDVTIAAACACPVGATANSSPTTSRSTNNLLNNFLLIYFLQFMKNG